MISDSIYILLNITSLGQYDKLNKTYSYDFTEKELKTLDKLVEFLKTWEDIHNNLILLKEMRENERKNI